MGVSMKSAIFWCVTLSRLVSGYIGFAGLFYPKDRDSHFIQNTDIQLLNYAAPHPRGSQSSKPLYMEISDLEGQ
jgi:hypothetical protein